MVVFFGRMIALMTIDQNILTFAPAAADFAMSR